MKRTEITTKELVEGLAAIEHEQWIHWSKAVAPRVSAATRRKWKRNWVPYAALLEGVKEDDRVWARRVIEHLRTVRGIEL